MKFVVKERQVDEARGTPATPATPAKPGLLQRIWQSLVTGTPGTPGVPGTPSTPSKKRQAAIDALNAVSPSLSGKERFYERFVLDGMKRGMSIEKLVEKIAKDMKKVSPTSDPKDLEGAARIMVGSFGGKKGLAAAKGSAATGGINIFGGPMSGGSGAGAGAGGGEAAKPAAPAAEPEDKAEFVKKALKTQVLASLLKSSGVPEDFSQELGQYIEDYAEDFYNAVSHARGKLKISEASPRPGPEHGFSLSEMIKDYISRKVTDDAAKPQVLASIKRAFEQWASNSVGKIDVSGLVTALDTFAATIPLPTPPVAPPTPPPGVTESKMFRETRPGVFALKG